MYQDLPLLADAQAKNILTELCLQRGISVELVERLIEIQRDNLGKGRQRGISQEFSAAIAAFLDEQGA
ncbi:DNA modification system-associated small protein [Desulfovibrio desulfuricans]|uniref:DNA modification system-associated small protein n=1 Tax=Desulfovibrio desulfuricans TaxID=876 RepID=UPI001AE42CAC|nr:DNA modification system-associated small protein [Desulfovibrio desulfuricans]QTO40863.1 hypothetical protein J8J02_02780 [Desulfovibrio desulfuricans]